MIFIRAISSLPLSILYVIADIIFITAFYITGYRKTVVYGNLRKAFPKKTDQEIRIIARKFYRHLADMIIETVHGLTISKKDLLRRVIYKNIEVINEYNSNGISVIFMTSHQNNWEWFTQASSIVVNAEPNGVYQKINNPFFENLMMKIRTRFNIRMIEKKSTIHDLIARKDVVKVVGIISDQSPVVSGNSYWTTFLNQETAFFTGTEKIAKKLNMSVVYAKMSKIRKGFYEIEFIPIDAPPFNPEQGYITKRFVELLEDHIKESPATWLWSHKRWKMKRQE